MPYFLSPPTDRVFYCSLCFLLILARGHFYHWLLKGEKHWLWEKHTDGFPHEHKCPWLGIASTTLWCTADALPRSHTSQGCSLCFFKEHFLSCLFKPCSGGGLLIFIDSWGPTAIFLHGRILPLIGTMLLSPRGRNAAAMGFVFQIVFPPLWCILICVKKIAKIHATMLMVMFVQMNN